MGEYLCGELDETVRRISTSFSGGMGDTRQEACGALSGGILLVGLLHGRADHRQDDSRCQALAARYREQFGAAFGATRCEDLRNSGYGSHGTTPCAVLSERAARLLLSVLDSSDEGT